VQSSSEFMLYESARLDRSVRIFPPGSVLTTGYRELIFSNVTRQAKPSADFTQSSKSKEITTEIRLMNAPKEARAVYVVSASSGFLSCMAHNY